MSNGHGHGGHTEQAHSPGYDLTGDASAIVATARRADVLMRGFR